MDNEKALIKECLEYNQFSGLVTWKKARGKVRVGGKFGCPNALGYLVGMINRKQYYSHRVAWLLMNGDWPKGSIDHINGNKADNRWINLRDVSHAENMRNQRKRISNTTGLTGVYRYGDGRYVAKICVGGRLIHLGVFDWKWQAAAARREAEAKYGFHENHGRAL